jgi:hypothetical protein
VVSDGDLATLILRDDVAALQRHLAGGLSPDRHVASGPLLLYASFMGRGRVVDALLAAGARVNTPAASSGWTPLHGAAAKGHDAIVAHLLAAGARDGSLDARTHDDEGVLHLPVMRGHVGVVRVLMRAGARTDVVATGGRWPGRRLPEMVSGAVGREGVHAAGGTGAPFVLAPRWAGRGTSTAILTAHTTNCAAAGVARCVNVWRVRVQACVECVRPDAALAKAAIVAALCDGWVRRRAAILACGS